MIGRELTILLRLMVVFMLSYEILGAILLFLELWYDYKLLVTRLQIISLFDIKNKDIKNAMNELAAQFFCAKKEERMSL